MFQYLCGLVLTKEMDLFKFNVRVILEVVVIIKIKALFVEVGLHVNLFSKKKKLILKKLNVLNLIRNNL